MPDDASDGSGRNPQEHGVGASNVTARTDHSNPEPMQLMEAAMSRENMLAAWRQVRANNGSAGVDEMTVQAAHLYLKEHWPAIREELLAGRYMPNLVRGVQIPKPGGKGMRQLGIPTVVDRLIQQSLHQVMCPIFDPGFSESSYGFRPGRSAHQAVAQARAYVADGRRWVVDIDLEKFFDRVNHDVLMARVARKVKDKRVLGLIRRYLQAGMMQDGLIEARGTGTPQGGPLSPLLSNIMLDDLDKELERRGHAFCRYADDCNIYVRSRQAGERVMETLTRFLEKRLKLKVNGEKSAVDRPWKRKFLGYSMTVDRQPKLKPAPVSVERFKGKVRETFRWGRGRSLPRVIEQLKPILRGWANYYKLAQVKDVFRELDEWIRRRMRCLLWRQWKRPRTRAKKLMQQGLEQVRAWRSAYNGRGPWWNAGVSHMNEAFPKALFDRLGLISLYDQVQRLHRMS